MEIYGADVDGIHGVLIQFGAKLEPGSGSAPIGLAGRVVKEGFIRAMKSIDTLDENWNLENYKITIQMDPAEKEKISSGLDLPIAITLLIASLTQPLGKLEELIDKLKIKADKVKKTEERSIIRDNILRQIEQLIEQKEKIINYKKRISEDKNKYLLIGTLKITSGEIEPPGHGMLGMLASADENFKVIVPEQSNIHAALVSKAKSFNAYKAKNLNEVWNILLGKTQPRKVNYIESVATEKKISEYIPDLNAIEGLDKAKLAVAVAIAGGHNILLVGPPGEGKTMISSAATMLLPELSKREIFEINMIYSAKGELKNNEVIKSRPFRKIDSGITNPALFGGGRIPKPGEISLAHKGILLFDEINLFRRSMIEELRSPLEGKKFIVQRQSGYYEYPCNFIMIASMNPCQCGFFNHYQCPKCGDIYVNKKICEKDNIKLIHKCTCNKREISAFKDKLSNPLKDRIDLKVLVSPYDKNPKNPFSHSSQTIRKKITKARELQYERYKGNDENISCNADIKDRSQYSKYDELEIDIKRYFNAIKKKLEISGRLQTKLLLVSRTIADIDQSRKIQEKHIKNAISLMGLNDPYFRTF